MIMGKHDMLGRLSGSEGFDLGYSGESDWLYWLEPAFEELQVQHVDQGLQTSRP